MEERWLFEPWLSRQAVSGSTVGGYRLWRGCGNVLHRLDDNPSTAHRVLFSAQPGCWYTDPVSE